MDYPVNSTEAIYLAISSLLFIYLAYSFQLAKPKNYKLFGLGLLLLGLMKLCALGVSMLWNIAFIDFSSLEYFFYILAVLVFFAVSAEVLKPKSSKLARLFLGLMALLICALYLINPTLSGATVYEARYYLSFNNPIAVNIFSLCVASSIGLASLVVAGKLNSAPLKKITEIGFLVVIICLIINILSFNDNLRQSASLALVLSELGLAYGYVRYAITTKK